MRTISIRIEFDSLVEDGSYDAVEQITQACIPLKLIVKEFYKQMNPDIWDGSGERPDSFDTHAWEYPLTDAVHLELAFGYDESDGGWKYFCDLVYSSDNSSFDMTSGHGIDSPQNIINSVMQLCREYE